MTIRVRPVARQDAAAWLRMRQALWPEYENGWHAKEIDAFLDGRLKMPLAVLVAVDDADRPIGFVELFIRPYAEHCETDRVAYLEGWYVEPEFRRKGVGRALITAIRDWAGRRGLRAITLETGAANEPARAFYAALGFAEEDVRLTLRL